MANRRTRSSKIQKIDEDSDFDLDFDQDFGPSPEPVRVNSRGSTARFDCVSESTTGHTLIIFFSKSGLSQPLKVSS